MKNTLFALALPLAFVSCSKHYDLVIKNGSVFDGSGTESKTADIGIIGDQIIKIGKINPSPECEVIDAQGFTVAPGFIDIHVHLDPILELSTCESHIRQGATTALGGPDGGGPWPVGKYLDTLESISVGMNVAFMAGHNKIRTNVMGLENRAPTEEELDTMKSQVAQAMEEGAFGLSTALASTLV